MIPKQTLQLLSQMAKGIARQFGENCEVLVHDLDTMDYESTIVLIENGLVTGRKLGDGPSQVVLEALQNDHSDIADHLAYLTRTKDGKILKSSTMYIRNDQKEIIGVFAINYDITLLLSMEEHLHRLTATLDAQKEPDWIPQNVGDLLEELIAQSVQRVGKPVSLMGKEDKVKALQFLNETGAFLITKSGDKVCKFFGISKYTLYSYLEEGKT